MKYIVNGKQMQAADKYTIENIGIPSMVLMERAALSVVEIMEKESLDFTNVLVVCGSGNNGGDGYAIARLLHLKGFQVTTWFVGDEHKRSFENQQQKNIADAYQIPTIKEWKGCQFSLIIDAIFGIGIKREVEGFYRETIEKINQMSGFRVSVDMPSGINDETGEPMGCAVKADLTVALAYAKLGHLVKAGNIHVGKLKVADIGIYDTSLVNQTGLFYTYEFEDFQKQFPKRIANSHKGNYGKVLLIVGSKGMAGAAQLCAKACYMVGAGLVHIYTNEENREILQKALPEAIVSTYNEYDEEELDKLLAWASVVGIGCGLGMSEVAQKITKHILDRAEVPCVVDADALNLIAMDSQIMEGVKASLILTPHMKEMSRLLQCNLDELQRNKKEKIKEFCEKYNVVCVLKDARTMIGCNKEKFYLNLTGNSCMAKGGSGDVLTGIITGVLAQKKEIYESACLGTYLHGLAGDLAAKEKGEYSVLASDLICFVSKVLKDIQR